MSAEIIFIVENSPEVATLLGGWRLGVTRPKRKQVVWRGALATSPRWPIGLPDQGTSNGEKVEVARDDGNGLQLPLGDEHTILNGLPYQLQK